MRDWILGGLILAAVPATAAPTVSVSPAGSSVTIGDEFDVSVVVDAEIADLSCYAITLDYDDTRLELISVTEGVLFTSAGVSTFFSQEQDEQGVDVWTNCLLGFGTSVAGPGELFQLRFKALLDGVTSLDVTDAVLRDVDRAVVPGVLWQDGSVTVGATATTPEPFAGSLRLVASPNPSAGPVRVALWKASAADAGSASGEEIFNLLHEGRLVIHDLAGRRVRSLPGPAAWDGRDAEGRRVAAGVYFVVFRHPSGLHATTKIVRSD